MDPDAPYEYAAAVDRVTAYARKEIEAIQANAAQEVGMVISDLEANLARLAFEYKVSTPAIGVQNQGPVGTIALMNQAGLPGVIVRYVCRAFGVSQEQIFSDDRHREVMDPREMCYYLLREYAGDMSFPKVAKVMKRDHSSVMNGHGKMAKRIATEPELAQFVQNAVKDLRLKRRSDAKSPQASLPFDQKL